MMSYLEYLKDTPLYFFTSGIMLLRIKNEDQIFFLLLTGLVSASTPVLANEELDPRIEKRILSMARSIANKPEVISAIKQQNITTKKLTPENIIVQDNIWRAEYSTDEKPLITKVIQSKISKLLQQYKKKSRGDYTEIFIMDNKGLLVGTSNITSDYWQGDEDKWQKTFLKDVDAFWVDKAQLDKSTNTYQVQVSVPVSENDTPIGALTIGVNFEH